MSRPEKVARFLARATTPQVCDALEKLHSRDGKLSKDEETARRWLLDELEHRHPEVEAGINNLIGALESVGEDLNLDAYVVNAVAIARGLASPRR